MNLNFKNIFLAVAGIFAVVVFASANAQQSEVKGIQGEVQVTSTATPTEAIPTATSIPTVILPTNTPTPKYIPPTSTPTPTVQPVTQTNSSGLSNDNTYINSAGNEVHSPAYSDSVPAGASAICGDGTYSFSQSRRGTCSHHGGVAQWL